jgi:hypothetical protein
LEAVLDRLARASRGEVDRASWQSLYKRHDESGGPEVTGWISTLFPYLKDRRTGRATLRNPWPTEETQRVHVQVIDGDEEGETEFEPAGPTIEQFPGGLSVAPFRWVNRGPAFDMEFLGGFVGVAQDEGTLALRPEIGRAVREAVGAARPGPGPG